MEALGAIDLGAGVLAATPVPSTSAPTGAPTAAPTAPDTTSPTVTAPTPAPAVGVSQQPVASTPAADDRAASPPTAATAAPVAGEGGTETTEITDGCECRLGGWACILFFRAALVLSENDRNRERERETGWLRGEKTDVSNLLSSSLSSTRFPSPPTSSVTAWLSAGRSDTIYCCR